MKERESFEKKNPLWKKFHMLADKIDAKEIEANNIAKEYFSVAYELLMSAQSKENIEEVLVAFESLKNSMLYHYPETVQSYEEGEEADLFGYFDSLIMKQDYEKEIKELKIKLKSYLEQRTR